MSEGSRGGSPRTLKPAGSPDDGRNLTRASREFAAANLSTELTHEAANPVILGAQRAADIAQSLTSGRRSARTAKAASASPLPAAYATDNSAVATAFPPSRAESAAVRTSQQPQLQQQQPRYRHLQQRQRPPPRSGGAAVDTFSFWNSDAIDDDGLDEVGSDLDAGRHDTTMEGPADSDCTRVPSAPSAKTQLSASNTAQSNTHHSSDVSVKGASQRSRASMPTWGTAECQTPPTAAVPTAPPTLRTFRRPFSPVSPTQRSAAPRPSPSVHAATTQASVLSTCSISTLTPVAGAGAETNATPVNDVSVGNHDFQQLLTTEVMSALRGRMQVPEDDTDESFTYPTPSQLVLAHKSPASGFLPSESSNHRHQPQESSQAREGQSRRQSDVTSGDTAAAPSAGEHAGDRGRNSLSLMNGSSTGPSTPPPEGGAGSGGPAAFAFQAWRFPSLGRHLGPDDPKPVGDQLPQGTATGAGATPAATPTTEAAPLARETRPATGASGAASPRPVVTAPASRAPAARVRGSSTGSLEPATALLCGSAVDTNTVAATSHAHANQKKKGSSSRGVKRRTDSVCGAGYRAASARVSTTSLMQRSGSSSRQLASSHDRLLDMIYAAYTRFSGYAHLLNNGGGNDTGAGAGGGGGGAGSSGSISATPCGAPPVLYGQSPRRVSNSLFGEGPDGAGSALVSSTGTSHYRVSGSSQLRPVGGTASSHSVTGSAPITGPSLNREPSFASSNLNRSFGYYSFGARQGVSPHPNRQALPYAVSNASEASVPLLPEQTTAPAMNAVLLERIRRRPLLQTTLFLHYAMARIRRAHEEGNDGPVASEHDGEADDAVGAAATAASALEPTSTVTATEASAFPAVAVAVGATTPSPFSLTSPKSSSLGNARDYPAPRRVRRTLTQVDSLVCKVHSIDGVERAVDNDSGDLVVYVGMVLMGWLEVVELLGKGSFGQVFLCKDLRICDGHFVPPHRIDASDFSYWNCCHEFLPFGDTGTPPFHNPLVAVKVVKSDPVVEQQSVLEAELLVFIGAQTADPAPPGPSPAAGGVGSDYLSDGSGSVPPPDPRCRHVAKVLADGASYGHHCVVMERYGANLYEYVRSIQHKGMPMYQVRSIGAQLLDALAFLHDKCRVIHADIKPENLLLTLDSSRSVRDFKQSIGESALALERTYAILQPNRGSGAALAGSPASETLLTPHAPHVAPPARGSAVLVEGASRRELEASLRDLAGAGRARASAGRTPHRASLTPSNVELSVPEVHRVVQYDVNRVTALAASYAAVPRSPSGASVSSAAISVTGRPPALANASAPAPRRRLSTSGAALPVSSAVPGTTNGGPDGSSGHGGRAGLTIKLIDFSSSCYVGAECFPYIQSRYYRAPEVLVGAPYGTGIDVWSAGCLLAELLLGIPLLPGANEHQQLLLIEEALGPLPAALLQAGTNTDCFYRPVPQQDGGLAVPGGAPAAAVAYTPLTREEFLQMQQLPDVEYRRFFSHRTLQELLQHCPLSAEERRMSNSLPPYPLQPGAPSNPAPAPSQACRAALLKQRFQLFDLLRRMLRPDPAARITAAQALAHPFFTDPPPQYMEEYHLT